MKKNGFTLIELLGVIVILALLVILVFPSIINSVRISSEKTDELTLQLIYNAADLYIDNNKNSFYKTNGNKYAIELKSLVDEGLLVSPIKLSESNDDLTNQKCIQVSYNNGFDYELKDTGSCKNIYRNGQVIYFDVITGKSCTNYHEDNSITGYNGIYEGDNSRKTTDNQNSCLKFYAFLDDGSKNLNLLLDHNTTAKLAWITSEITTNANGPIDVITQLKTDTDGWSNEIVTPNNYTYNHSTRPYTINYSEYKARLITAQEVAKITGADKENTLNFKEESSTGWYYFHDYSQVAETGRGDVCKTGGCKYGWLYDRTATNCTSYGCLNNAVGQTYGYWTSSAHASHSSNAWYVNDNGALNNGSSVSNTSLYGVRPVITILKSNI